MLVSERGHHKEHFNVLEAYAKISLTAAILLNPIGGSMHTARARMMLNKRAMAQNVPNGTYYIFCVYR